MKKKLILLIFMLSIQFISYSQSYLDWEDEDVEEFYEKVSVKQGTLNEQGEEISFVFVPTTIKKGVYEVEIADNEGDLYEIKGTDYYVTFRGYYGYAGYGDQGILVVGSSSWSSTFYKNPDS